ncbi:DsbA family oxidoreductase [Streptomyces fimicarius]|uniref:DsbA family oxidoreductase n=1 Tax=Streptomyces caviscabies TaxID=90079 RepID=A0ABW2M8Y4_9ACTN|nr:MULTISPECIES: DsbA family oxidoreductase [Streptomyces]WSV20421.1 DsbA family oxidoreductase [Streptomyces fimicarius]MCL6286337.1 DsbA family oxidoreductase [Streptomyces sp. 43Y-GA-1]MCX4707984.1 DsbA family oxidoreductase [Streptomyces griseus]MDX3501693.1 DsbA family oxidoreductase [Streptomyces sp. ATCC51928]MDX3591156.1 DsbA family oxidoreductase [Streptomyces sp. ID03-2B]
MRVEIWSDIACPWCYIGKARFEKGLAEFAHRDEVEVVHRSFELDPGRAKGETEQVVDMLAAKYGRTREEAASMEANVAANAQSEGLGYRTEGRDHGSTFDIHRLLHLAKARGRQDELLTLAYRANFAEERSVFDDEVLLALAVEAGLDGDEARAVLADPEAYADDVRTDEREAAELGANAVPFFVLDRRYGISGGQPSEVFVQALEQAWKDRPATALTTVGGDAAGCDADGACEVPGS